MFYPRCSLIKQVNAIILEQGATTDNLLTKVTGSSVIILQYVICCIETAIDLCISCVLATLNKDDDDDVDVYQVSLSGLFLYIK